MRLRNLKYPLLTANVYGIGDIPSPRHWNCLVAEGFLDGRADDEIVFDSLGREFRFASIELSNPYWTSSFFRLADNFFIPPKDDETTLAYVDAEMEVVAEHSLEEMKARIREILAANPHWRSGVSREKLEEDVQARISSAASHKQLIKNMLYMDHSKNVRLKGSKITTDIRTRKRAY